LPLAVRIEINDQGWTAEGSQSMAHLISRSPWTGADVTHQEADTLTLM
jgi:hypothetical protein